MRKILFLFTFSISLLTITSCVKNDTTPNNTADYKDISSITSVANQQNWGISAGDEVYVYGCKYDSEGAKLYRKCRDCNEMLILDSLTRISEDDTSDLSFLNLQILDGYLYYVLTDANDADRSGYLYRVNCETGVIERLSERKVYEYAIYDDKIYFSVFLTNVGVYSLNLDGSGEEQIYSKCLTWFWVYDGKIYYQDYLNDGYFRAQLKSISLDGEYTSEVVFDSKLNFTFTFTDNGELYCLDYSSSSTDLVKVDLDSKEAEVLVENIPFGKINTLDGEIYICISTDSGEYEAGIYHYDSDSNKFELILAAASSSICFIGNDQIVYSNSGDTEYTGRFWQLYLTDISGSFNEMLLAD